MNKYEFKDVSIDAEIVRANYDVHNQSLAGQDVLWDYNRYGTLVPTVVGYMLNARAVKEMYKVIWTARHHKVEEYHINENWYAYKIAMRTGTELIVLFRQNTLVSIVRPGTDVSNTIKFYDGKIPNMDQIWVNKTFKPEIENEVYDAEVVPQFTREEELEEIRIFVRSLRHRHLSGEEIELLDEIRDEIDRMV